MPLSPQDVRNKLFTPVRFKSGYDEDEVDAFLDEVEAELLRLGGELEQLQAGGRDGWSSYDGSEVDHEADGGLQAQLDAVRAEAEAQAAANLREVERQYAEQLAALRAESDAQLATMHPGPRTDEPYEIPVSTPGLDEAEVELRVAEARRAGQSEAQEHLARLTAQLQQVQGQLQLATQQAVAAASEVERLRAERAAAPAVATSTTSTLSGVSGVSEETLRRTLLLAQRTADEAVSEAREEAASIVSSARSDAEETARAAAAEHAAVTRRRDADHAAVIARGRAEHDLLVGKLEELRSFERDYRSRLRAYLHLQLRDLEAGAPEPTAAVTARQAAAIGGANGEAAGETATGTETGTGSATHGELETDPETDPDDGPGTSVGLEKSSQNGSASTPTDGVSLDLQPSGPTVGGHPDDVDGPDDIDAAGEPEGASRWFEAPEPVEEAR